MYLKISTAVLIFYNALMRLCLQKTSGHRFMSVQLWQIAQLYPSCLKFQSFIEEKKQENSNKTSINLLHCQKFSITLNWRSRLLSAILKRWSVLLFSIAWLTACGNTPPLEEDLGPRTRLVYVVSNGWHTAIVIPASALTSTGVLPETADFPDAVFLEFGWGDRSYYPAKEKTLGITLAAGLVPTSAIMHIAMLQTPPEDKNTELDVISVKLTEEGFQRLAKAISKEFERPTEGRAKPVSRGLYPDSHFYHAHGEFHLFNTCNTWTARMLRAGGIAISPSGIVTADGLMDRLREVLNVE